MLLQVDRAMRCAIRPARRINPPCFTNSNVFRKLGAKQLERMHYCLVLGSNVRIFCEKVSEVAINIRTLPRRFPHLVRLFGLARQKAIRGHSSGQITKEARTVAG